MDSIRMNNPAILDSAWLLTGLLMGGLAGLGTVLLLAPQSGKKTRFQIKQKSIELHERATETFDNLVALSHYDNRIILAGIREKAED